MVVKYAKIGNLAYFCLLFKSKWPKVTVAVTLHLAVKHAVKNVV